MSDKWFVGPDGIKRPVIASLALAAMPLAFMAVCLLAAVFLFADDTIYGPAQIVLILAGVIAALVGHKAGLPWHDLEKAAAQFTTGAMPAVYILLMVGTLIGVWMLAGVIPAMIYYGLGLVLPQIFYVTALLLSGLVAIAVGSSWTTAGTVGIAFVSIAAASGLDPAITAGAVISGAYFGDKLSPLSDTTNMAAGVTGTELFEHIRFLLWTTIPALMVALAGFTALSLISDADIDAARIESLSRAIDANFTISPLLLLPLLITLGLAAMRTPAILALLAGTLAGVVVAVISQPGLLSAEAVTRIWDAAANGFSLQSESEDLNALISRGGMSSMLNTIWLILSAMFFGGMMDKSGCLARLITVMLTGVQEGGSLVKRAGLTALTANIVTPDQALAITVTPRMYADKFDELHLARKNLSRATEDFGTVTSALIPWNTCGAFMAATLGVATLDYAPYAFFNIASPVIAFIYASVGFKIVSTDAAPSRQIEAQAAE